MIDKRTLEFILTDHESGEIEEDGQFLGLCLLVVEADGRMLQVP